jgi:anti-sigma factor RsiW
MGRTGKLSRPGPASASRFHLEDGGISAFYWIDDGLAYAIAANAPRDLLLKVAEIVYQQNSPEGARAKIPPVPGKPS